MTKIRIKRVKPKKKPKRSTLKNKCDKMWSEIIRSRGQCEICGTYKASNPHHVIGRQNYNLRWDILNGCLLCSNHHTSGRLSAHTDSIWFMEWFKENRQKDYEHLVKKKNIIWDKDYDKVLEYLREAADEII